MANEFENCKFFSDCEEMIRVTKPTLVDLIVPPKNQLKLIRKIAKFGTFELRKKKSRIGRNPKTKEKKVISERNVILFKPSKELKKKINKIYDKKV